MSYFFPFSDLTDRSPYNYSAPLHHRYSSFDPPGLPHLQEDSGDAYYPYQSIPRDRLGRDPLETRRPRYNYPYQVPTTPNNYQDSITAENARRLAEARKRHLAQRNSDDQTTVEVTLPDGRRCVVPLSWARKMQSKYPNILTNSKIRPYHPPSPPTRLDEQSTTDSDRDSDFYVLDPTQDPSVPSIPGSSSIPVQQPSSPQPPKHSPEELDSAARLIQQQFRIFQSLKRLNQIESSFHQLRDGFTYPSPLDITFIESPQNSSSSIPSKLAFNNPVNRPVQAFEESLIQLQIQADAVLSRGNIKVKNWRKELIKQIESQLEQLDGFKREAWNSLKLIHDKRSSQGPDLKPAESTDASPPEDENLKSASNQNCEDVEMNETTVNNDDEAPASQLFNNDESSIVTAPVSESKLSPPGTRPEDDMETTADLLGENLENLLNHRPNHINGPPHNVQPSVTQKLDCGHDDILVSPI